jgi:hypothetical protein
MGPLLPRWRFGLVLIVCALLSCPGPSTEQKWARSLAEGYLKNVFEGNVDAAAAYTVPDFKYDDTVFTVQLLKGKSWQITTENVGPDEAFFEGTWDASPAKDGKFLVRMIKKDGKWRVDKFTAHKT